MVETEPGLQGRHRLQRDQAGEDWKPAWWCRCPPFITEGEKIRVNTAEGTYQERA